MFLRYNYRLYPTLGQQRALARAFGCARVVYNDGIRLQMEARKAGQPFIKDTQLMRQLITLAKQTAERTWLADVPNVVLQQSLRDLSQAYRNFFDSLAGKREGARVNLPAFKSRKDTRQSIRFTRGTFKLCANGRLGLRKIGHVVVRWSRALPEEPSSVTIVKDAADRYFASFVVDVRQDSLPKLETEIGIDLGLTVYAVLSDGTVISNPRWLRRAGRKLRKAQQEFCRKQKGSKNRAKARMRVARAHIRVVDARRDWQQKVSTRLVRDNQAIYVEDLCVTGLARSRLAKSVHDASWGNFLRLLEQKALRYGRYFAKTARFEPTSQVCSECGVRDGLKPLSVRSWSCRSCGAVHDRDLNAAKNVLAAGRAERKNACGDGVRSGAESLRQTAVDEAGTHRDAA